MDNQSAGDKAHIEQSLHEVYEVMEESRGSAEAEEKVDPCLNSNLRAISERRLLRKLDMRFMPTIVLIYIMNYIDRSAITTARLKGLESDLSITDVQYDTAVAILYASYCTCQIPSNMFLNRVSRPSLYIGLCVMTWGLISGLTGITHNYAGIFACRFCLGIPEAAFYPGTVYLLSRWYTRKELAFRTSLLFSGMMCSSAFGSLMAAGILSNMEGKLGIKGWRWLFFIEGAITITVGLVSLWSLPDLTSNTRWLSPAERHLAQVRLAEDVGEADEDLAQDSMWRGLKMAATDIKVLIFAVMTLSMLLGLSFANFFPTLTSTLGYNTTITLLLAAPPWAWAAIVCCVIALHADKTGERFFHTCFPWWGVILGYIIALSTFSVGGRYVALFLLASGHAGFALTLVWVSNTIPRPPAKRAAAIGIVNGIGNTGNLIGSYAWKEIWGPEYHQSMAIGIAALSFSTLLAFLMRCILKHLNEKLDEGEEGAMKEANHKRVEDAARLEGISLKEAMERKKGFRYLY